MYGWTDQDIKRLTISQFFSYLSEGRKLQIEKQLLEIEAASFPHMTENSRMVLMRQYEYLINPPKMDKERIDQSWEFLKKAKRKC